ncbi:MAG: hypothetical protein LBN08_00185 [Lactobacillales bacterium]|jgi:hypothetical protein|nr:hypothetical protein [Lactobacillales bacterium]
MNENKNSRRKRKLFTFTMPLGLAVVALIVGLAFAGVSQQQLDNKATAVNERQLLDSARVAIENYEARAEALLASDSITDKEKTELKAQVKKAKRIVATGSYKSILAFNTKFISLVEKTEGNTNARSEDVKLASKNLKDAWEEFLDYKDKGKLNEAEAKTFKALEKSIQALIDSDDKQKMAKTQAELIELVSVVRTRELTEASPVADPAANLPVTGGEEVATPTPAPAPTPTTAPAPKPVTTPNASAAIPAPKFDAEGKARGVLGAFNASALRQDLIHVNGVLPFVANKCEDAILQTAYNNYLHQIRNQFNANHNAIITYDHAHIGNEILSWNPSMTQDAVLKAAANSLKSYGSSYTVVQRNGDLIYFMVGSTQFKIDINTGLVNEVV